MPLTKRVLFHASNFSSVESLQDHVERNLEADLQAHALARASGTLQQLALLSGYAFEIFHGLSLLTQDVSERTKSLQRRTESVTRRLSEVETAVRVLPTQPELSVKSYSAKYLKNTRNIALPPMLTKQTLSAALRQSLSLACRAPPPLWKIENLLQIDCFRYYTFPGLFFQAWLKSEIVRQELLKEERKQQKVLKKQAKQERKRLKEIALKRFQAQAHSEKEINEEGSTGSNRRSLRAKVINKRATITELVVEEKRARERQPEPVVERTSLEQEEKVSVQSEVVPAPSSNKKSIKNVLGLFKKSKSKKAKDIDVEAEKKSVADSEAASLTAQRRLSLVENQALAQHSSQSLQQIIARESAVNKQAGKAKKKGKEREKERAEEKEREKETEETEGVLRTHTLTNPLRNTETHSLAEIEEREREHREAASLSQAMSTLAVTPTIATAIVTPTAASLIVEATEEDREDREEREEKEEKEDAHLLQIDVKHKSKRVASMRQRAKFQSKSTQERERERELGRDRASVRGSYSSTNTEKRALLLDKTERPLSVAVNNFSSSSAAAVGSAAGYDYTDYAPLDDTQAAVRETETMSVASSITHTEAHTEKERDVRRNSLSLCTTDLQDFLAQQRERESEQDSTEQLLREIVSNVFDTDALTAAALSPSPSLPVSLAATKSSSLVMQMHTIHEEEESERDSEEEGEKQREQEWAERGEEEERETVFSQSETNDVSFVHKAQKERERDESAIDLLEELEREPEDEGGRWRERTEGESLLDELDVSLPLSLPLSPEEELLQALDGEDNEELPPPAEDEEEEIRESDALSSPPLSDLNERPSVSGPPLSPAISSSPPPPPPPKRRDSIQRENPLRASTASVSAPVSVPVPPPPRPPPPRPMPPQPRPLSQVAQPVQPAQPPKPPQPPLLPQPPQPPQPTQATRPSQPLPPSQPPRPSQPPLPPQPPQPAQPQQSTQPLPPRPAPAISLNVLEGIRSGQAALKPAEKPVERVVDLRSGLLSAIKAGGAQLKAVTVAPKPAAKSGMNNFMQSEAVAAILANRAKIVGSDSESLDLDLDSGWSDF